MGGKSKKKATVGYWYKLLAHWGLGLGPIDAFLEWRGGTKTAWSGELTATGTISINKPNLWGGEKDQGGIVSDVDVLFGEADQTPNAYLLANLGNQVPAWRGLATLVFKGGKYGALNPYPQASSFKIRRIKRGWFDGATECWYPEAAEIDMGSMRAAGKQWQYLVVDKDDTSDYSAPGIDDSGWPTGRPPFASADWSFPGEYGFATTPAVVVADAHKVWMRTTLSYSVAPTGLRFQAFVDNDCRLYVNGSLVLTVGANNGAYYDVAIPDGTFVVGENHVAVEGWDRHSGGGNWFWFDWRLTSDARQTRGMNPAHVLYYARTHHLIGREPVESMNDASWRAAADWYYAQGFGLCTSYDPNSESLSEFESRICKVAGCSITRSLTDGQLYIDIANGEYTLEDLPILTDDDVIEFSEQPTVLDAAVNSLQVKYFDPQTKGNVTTAPVQALGLIDAYGTITQVNEYPEIPTAALALCVADRDLRATATPLRAFNLTCTRTPRDWRPGTYCRLQLPKRGVADMVCIVGSNESGTLKSGAVKLTVTQDVYSLPSTSYVEQEPGVDTRPDQTPQPIVHQAAFEAPYIDLVASLSRADMAALPDDAGYLEACAADPSSSRNYTLAVQDAGGSWDTGTTGDWCPTATVNEAAGYLDTAFTLSAASGLDDVAIGSAALWDDEIVRVDALDAAAGTITLARGCADTVPAQHAAGSRLWFWQSAAAPSATEYTAGESLTVKLLTNTGSEQLPLASATAIGVDMAGRQARPYPPAHVQVNGEDYPDEIDGSVEFTWSHRDRVTQADQLIDTTAGNIGPETGTTYTVEYYTEAGTTPLDSETGITGTTSTAWAPPSEGKYRLELYSVRAGLESWQRWQHVVLVGAELWTPAHLTVAPKIWLDHTSPITDVSGYASAWANRGSAGGSFTQSTSSYRPEIVASGLNGRRILRFDGSNDVLKAGSIAVLQGNKAWHFVVLKKRTAATPTWGAIPTWAHALTTSNKLGLAYMPAGADANKPLLYGHPSGTAGSQPSITLDSPSINVWDMLGVFVEWGGGTATARRNGANAGTQSCPTSNAGAAAPSAFAIGCGLTGASAELLNGTYADVDIAAVMWGDGWNASEMSRVEGWAAHEYALASNLPVDHPFRYVPPYVNTPELQPSFASDPVVIGFVAATYSGNIGLAAGPAVATAFGTLLNSKPSMTTGNGIEVIDDGTDVTVTLTGLTPPATPAQAVLTDHKGNTLATIALTGSGPYTGSGAATLADGGVYYLRIEAA